MANYPGCPAVLPEPLQAKYNELAAVLWDMGTLRSLDADALARYVLLDWEYAETVKRVVSAVSSGDLSEVERWTAVQDRLHKQINTLADRFGMTPSVRSARGLLMPADR